MRDARTELLTIRAETTAIFDDAGQRLDALAQRPAPAALLQEVEDLRAHMTMLRCLVTAFIAGALELLEDAGDEE